MDSRQRVFNTLEFKPIDRVPRNLWQLRWVNIFAKDEAEALLKEFPEDFTGPGKVLAQGNRCRGTVGRKGRYIDEWGCVWEAAEDGVAGEVKFPLLSSLSALNTYTPPWETLDKADWDIANYTQQQNLSSDNPKFLLAGTSVRPFERLQFLRGTENLFMDMAYASVEFLKLLEMVHEFFLRELEGWSKTNVDAISFMDDWGSQTSLLISPGMWREYFKPLYKQYCDIAHFSGKKVFVHSDGHIMQIYPDLIEIGVDALNSQLFCMDIEQLGRLYRGRITFWGEIDRQRVLPFGSVEDVYKAVGRVRRALDNGNGGVIAQCEWGVNNPPENIMAVFKAWLLPLEKLL